MTFQFTPAVREQVSLLIALAGASGSGKTFSALRLAQGIAPGGKIAFIDTEARRGLHYADRFQFMHLDMRPPFSPARFLEAVQAAEQTGADVIIIDSFSLEHEGSGGLIEMAEEEERRGIKSPGNWARPKAEHKKLMKALLQCRATLIFCLRADEKIEIVREGGKTQVRPLGWVPICEKRFMYEQTVSFTLRPDAPGRPQYDLPHKCNEIFQPFFPDQKPIGEDAGRALADWARGAPAPPRHEQISGEAIDDDLGATADLRAEAGTTAYVHFWKSLTPAEQRRLLPAHEARKARAAQVDAERAGEIVE
ncbi:MAG: hypothetical protein RIS45_1569 [Planctomycetota bacterium]